MEDTAADTVEEVIAAVAAATVEAATAVTDNIARTFLFHNKSNHLIQNSHEKDNNTYFIHFRFILSHSNGPARTSSDCG